MNWLSLISHFSNVDRTLCVTNGIGPDFLDIIDPIHTHEMSFTFEMLYDLLVSHES